LIDFWTTSFYFLGEVGLKLDFVWLRFIVKDLVLFGSLVVGLVDLFLLNFLAAKILNY